MLQINTSSKKRMETTKNNINTKMGQNEPKQPLTRTRGKNCNSNNSSSSNNNNSSNNKLKTKQRQAIGALYTMSRRAAATDSEKNRRVQTRETLGQTDG